MKKTSSPSTLNATKKYASLNLNTVYKPNGSGRPGQNGRMLLGTVKKGVVKKAPPPTAPKPLNLPSVKKENAGYDPKIALVPSGGSGWSGSEGQAPNGHPGADSPAPAPMSTSNSASATPDTAHAENQSTPPAQPTKSMAWGGRGMQKPAPTTTPAQPPPQMMPIRPTEDLNRWVGGSSAGRRATMQQRMHSRQPEQWPTLGPTEENANNADDVPQSSSAPSNSVVEIVDTDRDDAWADIDDEMNYDDADKLFDDDSGAVEKPAAKELSEEEAHALQIARSEAAEQKRQDELQLEAEQQQQKEEAEEAAKEAAKRQEERRRVEAEAEARRKAEALEREAREREAREREVVHDSASIQATLKQQAEEARERRKREEEQLMQERKARADAKLREIEERKENARIAREKEEAELRQKRREEEETRQQQRQSAWSAPERHADGEDGPSIMAREGSNADGNPEFKPSSILKRDTSRRKLWVPDSEKNLDKSPPAARNGKDRLGNSFDYQKKFAVADQRDWRERRADSKEKEKADQKMKREQREKERNTRRDKADKKSDVKAQSSPDDSPAKAGRKNGAAQISLPVPKPKEDEEHETGVPGVAGAEAADGANAESSSILKTPTADWSYMKIRRWCDQHGIFKYCEQQSIPFSKNNDDKTELLRKYELWHVAKEAGEITSTDKPKRTRGTRRGKKEEAKKENTKSETKEDLTANAEEADSDEGRKRRSRGSRRGNRRDDAVIKSQGSGKDEPSPKGEEASSAQKDAKAEPKPSALQLDDRMGLQEISGGLKVGADGGFAVVESQETVEDDSGFTTEVTKKEKKDAQKEARAQHEKEARLQRRREEKDRIKQDNDRQRKAAQDKAKASENKPSATNGTQSSPPAQAAQAGSAFAAFPQPFAADDVSKAPRAPSIRDTASTVGPAPKPAWGGAKPDSQTNKSDFNLIMMEEKFKQRETFPESQNFEVPAPQNPPSGSGPIGAERKPLSDLDPWAKPAPASGSAAFAQTSIPFEGVGGFTASLGGYDGLHMVTQQMAQFTALPSFASHSYNNAFSATPTESSNLGGWGGAAAAAPFSQQLPGGEGSGKHGPAAGWSANNQKPVGPTRNDAGNGTAPGKQSSQSDKQKRNARGGGKGRGSGGAPKARETRDSNNAKSKDAVNKNDHRASNRNGRKQYGNRPVGGAAKNQSQSGSAPGAATVDAVVPANRSAPRRGGRNNSKKGSPKTQAPEN